LPTDLVLVNLGDRAAQKPELVAAFKKRWGLDQPLPIQYVTYLGHLARGDLGISINSQRPVIQELWLSLPATIELSTAAMVIAIASGVLLGVVSATHRDSLWDFLVRGLSSLGMATPTFWLAVLMLFVFYFYLGWSPAPGRLDSGLAPPSTTTGMYTIDALLSMKVPLFWNALEHLVLPSIVLAATITALIVRVTRSSMVDVLGQDFVRTAHAKGLTRSRVLGRHALRSALIPIITVTGTLYGQLMSGTILTETIFSWPGLGRYAFVSASSLDFPAIMGVAFFVGVVYILINLAVDVLYASINPRIRFG
jgi:peptide/nickel transport system permease protein